MHSMVAVKKECMYDSASMTFQSAKSTYLHVFKKKRKNSQDISNKNEDENQDVWRRERKQGFSVDVFLCYVHCQWSPVKVQEHTCS